MGQSGFSRVFHIDALRGVAILMMLQGHFIDTLLRHQDRVGTAFDIWKYCRGLTAPVFFTTSGVIVVYLLIRKPDISYRKMRLKKAFWRGLEVMMWGYLLRFNVWPFLMEGKVYKEFWRIDVLQCIGVGLISLAFLYFLVGRFSDNLYRILLPLIAVAIFALHPVYSIVDYSDWPPAIRNYLTREYGSVFTILPFLGYVFVGAFLGSMYTSFYEKRKELLIGLLIFVGLFLTFKSSWAFNKLYLITDIELFKKVAWNNFGFTKLGQVLLIYSTFMIAEPVLERLKILNQIGQHTLTVYIIHFILLYGSWYGLGIDDILFEKGSLPAEAAIPGALIFVVGVSWLTLRYHKWKDAGYPLSRG